MKHALITTTLGKIPNRGHLYMIQPLKELGYKVTWAANFSNIDKTKVMSYVDEIIDLPMKRIFLHPANFISLLKMRKIAKESNFSLVHCNTPTAGILSRLAFWNIKKTKIIYTAHGFHFYEGSGFIGIIMKYVEKKLSNKTHHIITINEEDRIAAEKFNTCKVSKIHGVGIDLTKYENKDYSSNGEQSIAGLDKNKCTLTYVGEMNKNKNVIAILKTIKKFNMNNINVILCGTGNKETTIKKYISKHKLFNVHYLGFRKDIDYLLSISSIFISLSKREGLPRSVMEAMASKLPVIVSNIRGNKDLVDSNGGFLVKENDYKEIFESISKLVIDNKLRYDMGQYNFEKIREFDILTNSNEMKKIYTNILENS